MCVCVCVCVGLCLVLPALVPVGGKKDEYFAAVLVWGLQNPREPVHQCPFDTRVIHLTHIHTDI